MERVLIKPIPNQVTNELAAYGPFDFKRYVQAAEGTAPLQFSAELKDGRSLPKGLICTSDGILTGIPAKDTQGNYEVLLTYARGGEEEKIPFFFTIKPSFANNEVDYFDKLKAQVWEALEQHLPPPEWEEWLNRPVSKLDVYYLLERWGILTIWDAFNLEPPTEKRILNLEDASPHYNVYDRESSLVGCPKDLFSHERTLLDGLQTARAMAREVFFERNWTIELAGPDKLIRQVWVEIQHLNDIHGRSLEIINYQPSPEDIRLYAAESLRVKSEFK